VYYKAPTCQFVGALDSFRFSLSFLNVLSPRVVINVDKCLQVKFLTLRHLSRMYFNYWEVLGQFWNTKDK